MLLAGMPYPGVRQPVVLRLRSGEPYLSAHFAKEEGLPGGRVSNVEKRCWLKGDEGGGKGKTSDGGNSGFGGVDRWVCGRRATDRDRRAGTDSRSRRHAASGCTDFKVSLRRIYRTWRIVDVSQPLGGDGRRPQILFSNHIAGTSCAS